MHRLHLAKERDDLVEKKLVTNQAAFLFTAMRQKMLAVLLAWHRRLMGVVLQVWNSNAGGCDNGMNQTSIPNIPTIKRWSRPTFAPPARLTFADHMNCFIAGDRAPSSPEGAKMLARAGPALDRGGPVPGRYLRYGTGRCRQSSSRAPSALSRTIADGYAL